MFIGIVVGIVLLSYGWWLVGGVHLEYLKNNAPTKAQEICGNDSHVIYQGYQRSVFFGFGGRVWFQCKIDNVWYEFAITRRVNSSEFQIYNFEQKTTFPNQFNITN